MIKFAIALANAEARNRKMTTAERLLNIAKVAEREVFNDDKRDTMYFEDGSMNPNYYQARARTRATMYRTIYKIERYATLFN